MDDFAIRVGELADSNLVARRLDDIHYGLFASRECLARHGAPSTPGELRGKPHRPSAAVVPPAFGRYRRVRRLSVSRLSRDCG